MAKMPDTLTFEVDQESLDHLYEVIGSVEQAIRRITREVKLLRKHTDDLRVAKLRMDRAREGGE